MPENYCSCQMYTEIGPLLKLQGLAVLKRAQRKLWRYLVGQGCLWNLGPMRSLTTQSQLPKGLIFGQIVPQTVNRPSPL